MENYKDHEINGKWVEVKRCIPQGQIDPARKPDDRCAQRSLAVLRSGLFPLPLGVLQMSGRYN